MEDRDADRRLTRRQTLGIAGAAGSAVVLGGGGAKLLSQMAEEPDEVTAATAAKSCKLTPEVTEGPFYVALDKIRGDITAAHAQLLRRHLLAGGWLQGGGQPGGQRRVQLRRPDRGRRQSEAHPRRGLAPGLP
jgi:hypothetical protein